MTPHPSREPSADTALDDELERALAVEPSPEFVARIRTGIAQEAMSSRWSLPRLVAVAGLALVPVVALVLLRPAPRPSTQPIDAVASSSGPAVAPPVRLVEPTPEPAQPAVVRERPSTPRARAAAAPRSTAAPPEVLIAADEAEALQRLLAGIRDGRVDPASIPPDPFAVAAAEPVQLAIAPITVAPLVIEEGEHP